MELGVDVDMIPFQSRLIRRCGSVCLLYLPDLDNLAPWLVGGRAEVHTVHLTCEEY